MAVYVDFDADGLVERYARQKERPEGEFYEVVVVTLQEVVVGEVFPPGSPEPIEITEMQYRPVIDPATQVGIVDTTLETPFEDLCKDAETGFLVPRPKIPDLAFDPASKTLSLGPLPLMTEIEVFDMTGEEQIVEFTTDVADWSDQLVFADAGRYRVEIRPLVPFLHVTEELDIADQT